MSAGPIEPAETSEASDREWTKGHRAAWTSMLATCLREIGYEDTNATRAKWVLEREATLATLRSVCGAYGDNDWDEKLHLADVVNGHLGRHLDHALKRR